MSAYEFVQQQLREDFAITSRLTEELAVLREQQARAEARIQRLEEALAALNSENVMSSESAIIGKSDADTIKMKTP